MIIRLVKTSEEVDCDRDLKLDGDLIEVLGLQTNVQSSKVKVKVRVWNIGSQLEHRCSYSMKFLVFCTIDVGIDLNLREGDEIDCVVEVLHEERFETFALSSMNLLADYRQL